MKSLNRRSLLKLGIVGGAGTLVSCNFPSIKNFVGPLLPPFGIPAAHGQNFNTDSFFAKVSQFVLQHKLNFLGSEPTLDSAYHGQQIFDKPVLAVGDATDPLFLKMRSPQIVGPNYKPPLQWMPDAKSVITYFFPLTSEIRSENVSKEKPTHLWLHSYISSYELSAQISSYLKLSLEQMGYKATVPSWSERHTGYICGLGTFGMSKGLITEKGMAGRLGSIITNAPLPVTRRTYSKAYERCIRCGACEDRCPAGAIDFSRPDHEIKDNRLCKKYQLENSLHISFEGQIYNIYACGKCHVGVPCELNNPSSPANA